MKSHQIFFFSGLFFLIGVFLKSLGVNFPVILTVFLFAGSFILLYLIKGGRKFLVCSSLSLIIFLGSFYYTLSDTVFRESIPRFDGEVKISGVIVSNPVTKENSRDFYLKLDNERNSKILVRFSKYPSFNYGDIVEVKGEIKPAEDPGYGKYLAKEGIGGIMYFPEIKFLESGGGSPVKRILFSFKNRMHGVFKRVVPPREAAFLNGITLGGYEGFTSEFRESMSLSGTTHLVALSGYNITIIIIAFSALFLSLFSRRTSYVLTSLFIIAFVLMTGAEASVVRAAIMGILVLFAESSGRVYDLKNAVLFTALVMVLVNPKILVFDVGFQLSFLAVLGILYLKGPIWNITRMKPGPGILSWRENLFTTASAQLAVAPVLILNFGNFSPVSLLANIVILELIPITMFLGFLILLFSLFSYYVALAAGWLAGVFLFLETGLIEFFAGISVPLKVDLGIFGFACYYLLLWLIIKRSAHAQPSY